MKTLETARDDAPAKSRVAGFDSFEISDYVLDCERAFAGAEHPSLWSYATPVIGEVTIAGQRTPPRVYHSGDYRLTCPGVDLVRRTEQRATIRGLHFAPETFKKTLGDIGQDLEAQFGRLQTYTFRSDLLDSVLIRLHQSATEPRPGDRLYTDSLINAAVLELWRLAGGDFEALSQGEKTLSSVTLRAIDRHIDEHGASKITATALADIAGMPPAVFQSAFRRSTGKTPYQHVLGRRVSNARCMIETSSLSLAEIAFRSGFSSQSHMTDVFKSRLGVTPGGLRRAVS